MLGNDIGAAEGASRYGTVEANGPQFYPLYQSGRGSVMSVVDAITVNVMVFRYGLLQLRARASRNGFTRWLAFLRQR